MNKAQATDGTSELTGTDQRALASVVKLAVDNVAADGGPFAALVVRHGEIIATGVNRVTRDLDPTAHAEIVAIREACRRTGDFRLGGCTLVSSCEPCPMCVAAALWSRVDRVVYAADRHAAARAGFDDLAFYNLFVTPRSQWTVQVEHCPLPSGDAPFDAWLSHSARIEY